MVIPQRLSPTERIKAMDRTVTTLRIPNALYAAIGVVSKKQGISRHRLMLQAIEDFCEKHGVKVKA